MAKQQSESLLPTKAVLAAGAIKTLADVPKFVAGGEIEKAIRQKLKVAKPGTPKAFTPKSLRQSLTFARRAASGSLPGLLTFPILTSGIKDVSSDDRGDKVKGLGKVLAAGGLYSAVKGAAEHGARHKMLADPPKVKRGAKALLKAAPKAKLFGGAAPYVAGAIAKGIPGTLAALVPAAAVATGMKNKDEKSSKSMLRAGLAGGVATAARGGIERSLFFKKMGTKMSPKVAREILATMGSKGAAGIMGGLILDRAVRYAMKGKKVKPKPFRKELEG